MSARDQIEQGGFKKVSSRAFGWRSEAELERIRRINETVTPIMAFPAMSQAEAEALAAQRRAQQ